MELNGRSHQREMGRLAGEIIAGNRSQRDITLDVTPGGGKTGAATLLANELLDAGQINRVLWVVPRLSLADQVCQGFASGYGSRGGRLLEPADGRGELFPATLPNTPLVVGHVTTYQSIATGKSARAFAAAASGGRTLVILDEVQFLSDEGEKGWFPRLRRVTDAAGFRLLMSGTLWRTDNRRIPLVRYELNPNDGKHYPRWDIQYSLSQAVAERAVLPIEWHTTGGRVEYIYGGQTCIHDLLQDDDDEESRKVRSFLAQPAAVDALLARMVEDWRQWRERVYASRMIVVAQDTAEARRIAMHLERQHKVPCVLATSKELNGQRAVRRFRDRSEGQCLVTVAMAYVGFDCPDLTHMAYLTPTRAPSWMLQCFARVSRHDRKAPVDYDHQCAFVYAPDDVRMRRFMDWLRHEREVGILLRKSQSASTGSDGSPDLIVPDDFEPINATVGSTAVETLRGRIEPAAVARLDDLVRRCPDAAGIPMHKLHAILEAIGDNGRFLGDNP